MNWHLSLFPWIPRPWWRMREAESGLGKGALSLGARSSVRREWGIHSAALLRDSATWFPERSRRTRGTGGQAPNKEGLSLAAREATCILTAWVVHLRSQFQPLNIQCWSKKTQLWIKNISWPPWMRGLNFEHSSTTFKVDLPLPESSQKIHGSELRFFWPAL